jgi:hypothetical protein
MVLIKERPVISEKVNLNITPEEVMAYCPECKAYQTLWFSKGRLTPTRKFSQRNDEVFHDCGSNTPCRLYRTF